MRLAARPALPQVTFVLGVAAASRLSYVDTDPLAPDIEHVNRLIGQTLLFNVFGRARFDEDAVEG